MAQRSAVFVVWRWKNGDATLQTRQREFIARYADTKAAEAVKGVGMVSLALSDAIRFDRASAFTQALNGAEAGWRVSEVVSDPKLGLTLED